MNEEAVDAARARLEACAKRAVESDERADPATRRRIDDLTLVWTAALDSWDEARVTLDRRYQRIVWLVLTSIVLTITFALAGGAALRHNVTERTDMALERATYRICQRELVDRAFAAGRIGRNDRERAGILYRLPILDCLPNLEGKPAKPLPIDAQLRFVRKWVDGTLTLREQGICTSAVTDKRVC
jgi:hypothetical protein